MRPPRPIARPRWAVASSLVVSLGLASGCHFAAANLHNLEALHEPDGTPRRRADLQGDIEYLFTGLMRETNFGSEEFREQQSKEDKVDDPNGECLDNLVELGESDRDERIAGLEAATYSWLAVDCEYVLSRERCALELGPLARDLRVPQRGPLPEGEPASAEAVAKVFDELLAVARDVVAAPGLAGDVLEEKCDEIAALPLERDGALRLLRAASRLLEGGEKAAVLAPLRSLRGDLAQRCVVLALRKALEDPHGRVRAAALESALYAFPAERDAKLRWAVTERMDGVEQREEVSLRALQLLAQRGLPDAPEGLDPATQRREWEDILVQVLRLSLDGQHNVAACQALAHITGEPSTIHPEHWVARWRAQQEAARESTGEERAAPEAPAESSEPAGGTSP